MLNIEKNPRITAKQVFGNVPESILDHMKALDPFDPDEEEEASLVTGTILDHYAPIGEPKEDPNEKCYWDKKVIKEKRELEKSAARMHAENSQEARNWNEAALQQKAAVSAARRKSGPDGGLGYYALFK